MTHFTIVPSESVVHIEAKSSLHPIHSETSGLEGFFEASVAANGDIDMADGVKARLELQVNLLTSGNSLYDREMQRRIDARRYPNITGELTEIHKAADSGRYMIKGDLTFKGVTRTYEDEMSISLCDADTLCLEGQHVFDIRDFGVDPPKILTLRVHPEVSVKVKITARAETI